MTDPVTSNGDEETKEDLLNLLGTVPTPFPPTVATKKLKAWHRPRKQFVRQELWVNKIRAELVSNLELTGDFRYLTLPGDDYLDVSLVLEEIVEPNNLLLTYIGFNWGLQDGTDAEPSLLGSNHVNHDLSRTLREDLRTAGLEKSPAWLVLRQTGPFHAINLDLCGGFRGNKDLPSLYEALDWILKFQEAADHPCLLFITFKVDEQNFTDCERTKLWDYFIKTIDSCQPLTDAVKSWLPSDGMDIQTILNSRLDEGSINTLGFLHWLYSRALSYNLYPSSSGIMSYRVRERLLYDDMVSIAVCLKPKQSLNHDPVSMSGVAREEDICVASADIPQKMSETVRVDKLLREDDHTWNICRTEQIDQLVRLGYDRNEIDSSPYFKRI